MGIEIRKLRKERGMTQMELSEKSQVPRICITRYEAGQYKPGIENAKKLAVALGVTVDELIGEGEAS